MLDVEKKKEDREEWVFKYPWSVSVLRPRLSQRQHCIKGVVQT